MANVMIQHQKEISRLNDVHFCEKQELSLKFEKQMEKISLAMSLNLELNEQKL
jgi:hypothetical protein